MNRVEKLKQLKGWCCSDCLSQKDLLLVRLWPNDSKGGTLATLCEKCLKFYREVMVDEPEVID